MLHLSQKTTHYTPLYGVFLRKWYTGAIDFPETSFDMLEKKEYNAISIISNFQSACYHF